MKKASQKKKEKSSKDDAMTSSSPTPMEVDPHTPGTSSNMTFAFPNLHRLDPDNVMKNFSGLVLKITDGDKPIHLEELDHLQIELESALVKLSKRNTTLEREIEVLDAATSGHSYFDRLKVKQPSPSKLSNSKRHNDEDGRQPKRIKDEAANMDLAGAFGRISTAAMPEDYMNDIDPFIHHVQHEESPLSPHLVHKFEVPTKFWKSVEPYCAPITQDNISFLEQLLKGTDESERLLQIPPTLGKKQLARMLEEDGKTTERAEESKTTAEADEKAACMLGVPLERIKQMRRAAPPFGPLTQRLFSSLASPSCGSSKGVAPSGPVKGGERKHPASSLNANGADAMEKRLKSELEETGLMEQDDENNNADDELMVDWRMTAKKLAIVSKTNREILNYLLKQAKVQLKKQEVFNRLDVIDQQGIETHQKIVQARQKKKTPLMSKKEREAGWKLLMERQELVAKLKQFNEELDASYSNPFEALAASQAKPARAPPAVPDAGDGPSTSGVAAVNIKDEPMSPGPSNSLSQPLPSQ